MLSKLRPKLGSSLSLNSPRGIPMTGCQLISLASVFESQSGAASGSGSDKSHQRVYNMLYFMYIAQLALANQTL